MLVSLFFLLQCNIKRFSQQECTDSNFPSLFYRWKYLYFSLPPEPKTTWVLNIKINCNLPLVLQRLYSPLLFQHLLLVIGVFLSQRICIFISRVSSGFFFFTSLLLYIATWRHYSKYLRTRVFFKQGKCSTLSSSSFCSPSWPSFSSAETPSRHS